MNGFDSVARYYDRLARLVFGDSIVKAQIHFLHLIEPSANVLILGGGSGWILDELNTKQRFINVWYIELSGEMLAMARKRETSFLTVNFIHGSEQNIPHGILFDVVITNFFLDQFRRDKLNTVIETILPSLKAQKIWLVSDFVSRKWWHRILLWIMYRFFRFATKLDAKELPPWEKLMSLEASEVGSYFFFKNFIKSSVFRKE